jgi:hypothetical protein
MFFDLWCQAGLLENFSRCSCILDSSLVLNLKHVRILIWVILASDAFFAILLIADLHFGHWIRYCIGRAACLYLSRQTSMLIPHPSPPSYSGPLCTILLSSHLLSHSIPYIPWDQDLYTGAWKEHSLLSSLCFCLRVRSSGKLGKKDDLTFFVDSLSSSYFQKTPPLTFFWLEIESAF